jgi:hypothetical protein
MRNIIFTLGAILFISGILSSCKKDPIETSSTDTTFIDTIDISPIPKITFIEITPSSVQEFQDSIVISLSYIDGDGDLGENTADIENAFITDKRNNVTYGYRINQLGPYENVAITGKLNLVIKNTAITNNTSSEMLQYDVYVKDRAGNSSNIITTSEIEVNQ